MSAEGVMWAEVAAVLADHQRDPRPGITPGGNPVCLCGWSGAGHLRHVANLLTPLIAERVEAAKAEALAPVLTLADEWERRGEYGDASLTEGARAIRTALDPEARRDV